MQFSQAQAVKALTAQGLSWAQGSSLTMAILSHLVEQLPVGALATSKNQMIAQLLHSQTGLETQIHIAKAENQWGSSTNESLSSQKEITFCFMMALGTLLKTK